MPPRRFIWPALALSAAGFLAACGPSTEALGHGCFMDSDCHYGQFCMVTPQAPTLLPDGGFQDFAYLSCEIPCDKQEADRNLADPTYQDSCPKPTKCVCFKPEDGPCAVCR